MPPLVVGHIRVALGVDAGIAAGQESERTLWRHRDFVRARVGTRYVATSSRAAVRQSWTKLRNESDIQPDTIHADTQGQ